MKQTKKNFALSIFPFLTLFLVSTAWSETVVTPIDKNTLVRQFDNLIVMGSELKENLGKPIPLMRLFACRDGKMQPIPYQIDELTEDGDWVLPHKSPYLSEKQAKKSKLIRENPHQVMDENDELVFMAPDAGDRAAPSDWPAGWLHADEITLTDPLTNEQGWVYLLSFSNPPEPSPVDYVEYNLPPDKKDGIQTDFFTLGFSHEVPITYDYEDFNDGNNIYDRLKVRMFFRFFRFIKFDRNENDMKSTLWQYKDGPVRVVRMVRSSIRLIGQFQSPQVNSETLYYRNFYLIPFRLKILKLPKGVVNEAFVDSGSDFRDLYGWKVRLNTDERWMTVDGKMDEVEKNIKTDGGRWYFCQGPGKAWIAFMNFAEDYGMETKFSYLDDDVNEHPPEFHPGQVPYIGWRVYGLEKAREFSTWHLKSMCFFLKGEYSEPEILQLVSNVDNPIQISVEGLNNTVKEVLLNN